MPDAVDLAQSSSVSVQPPTTSEAQLVLLRHSQSVWNAADRFTGWIDVPLSDFGREQAYTIGRLLLDHALTPTSVHTSELRRAIDSAKLTIAAANAGQLPIKQAWQLNERHYGALQGTSRDLVRAKEGAKAYQAVRRSWHTRPLPATSACYEYPLLRSAGPTFDGESLSDVSERVLSYWHDALAPQLTPGCVILVVAHGNSLRALVKYLEDINDDAVVDLEVAVGRPRLYRFDLATPARAIGEDLECC